MEKKKLPNVSWLVRNGYVDLLSSMRCHPEKFESFELNRDRKEENDHVEMAEKLAKENGGILPYKNLLRKRGYSDLANYIQYHPDKFSHIYQDNGLKTVDDHLKTAEILVEENGGTLPNSKWLRNNGFRSLDNCIRKFPESFLGVAQKKMKKSIEEHIKTAEELSNNNGGILQNCKWLEKNGHADLLRCLYEYPEKFSHVQQTKLRKQTNEHVEIAEKLVKENNGVLQNYYWLQTNGYADLNGIMRKYPEYFLHIKQERKRTNIADHMKEYLKIFNENKKHPTAKWLKDNGYLKLYESYRRNKKKFDDYIHKNGNS